MLRTLRCACGATFDASNRDTILGEVERHLLAAHTGELAVAPRRLTEREEQIAALAATGSTNDEMAAELGLSPKTVESHLTRVYRKLRVRSRTELAALGGSGVSPRPDGSLSK